MQKVTLLRINDLVCKEFKENYHQLQSKMVPLTSSAHRTCNDYHNNPKLLRELKEKSDLKSNYN